MSNVEKTTSWQQIQQGVKDAERLIARKEYNLSLIHIFFQFEQCLAEGRL